MPDRFSLNAAVYLLLIRDDEVLLSRRYKTGWSDGMYSLVSGHADGGEPLTLAMCREAKEETGIVIDPKDLVFAHVMHRNSNREYVDFFFTTSKWAGEPRNTEPDKCDELAWFPIDNMPENTLPYIKKVIEDSRKGVAFSEVDWQSS